MRLRSPAASSGCYWIVFAGAGRLRWRPAMGFEGGLEGGLEGRRVLFISYNGMLEPLGQSQVIPYLRELAKRGVSFTLLSFERNKAFKPEGARQCEQLRQELSG